MAKRTKSSKSPKKNHNSEPRQLTSIHIEGVGDFTPDNISNVRLTLPYEQALQQYQDDPDVEIIPGEQQGISRRDATVSFGRDISKAMQSLAKMGAALESLCPASVKNGFFGFGRYVQETEGRTDESSASHVYRGRKGRFVATASAGENAHL